MPVTTLTPSAALPLSLVEAKKHLRVDTSDDDAAVTAQLFAAVNSVESHIWRKLIVATLQLTLRKFPVVNNRILLPVPPLVSVDSITYTDDDDTLQTLATSAYNVVSYEDPGSIEPVYGTNWPTIRSKPGGVTITFKAGYAAKITSVDDTANTITITGRTVADGDKFTLYNSGGALPAPLAAHTQYTVESVDGAGTTFGLSDGTSSVDLTDTGSGDNFLGVVPPAILHAIKLSLGDLYDYRNTERSPGTAPANRFDAKSALLSSFVFRDEEIMDFV